MPLKFIASPTSANPAQARGSEGGEVEGWSMVGLILGELEDRSERVAWGIVLGGGRTGFRSVGHRRQHLSVQRGSTPSQSWSEGGPGPLSQDLQDVKDTSGLPRILGRTFRRQARPADNTSHDVLQAGLQTCPATACAASARLRPVPGPPGPDGPPGGHPGGPPGDWRADQPRGQLVARGPRSR